MQPTITIMYTNANGKKVGKNIELPVNDDEWAQSALKSAVGIINQLVEAREEFEELERERIANGG